MKKLAKSEFFCNLTFVYLIQSILRKTVDTFYLKFSDLQIFERFSAFIAIEINFLVFHYVSPFIPKSHKLSIISRNCEPTTLCPLSHIVKFRLISSFYELFNQLVNLSFGIFVQKCLQSSFLKI